MVNLLLILDFVSCRVENSNLGVFTAKLAPQSHRFHAVLLRAELAQHHYFVYYCIS